jgi:hypothetical protein
MQQVETLKGDLEQAEAAIGQYETTVYSDLALV